MSLLPLPEPNIEVISGHREPFVSYDADQLLEYGQACREAALEEAAIDAERNGHLWSGATALAFFKLAEQIRSLK